MQYTIDNCFKFVDSATEESQNMLTSQLKQGAGSLWQLMSVSDNSEQHKQADLQHVSVGI